MSDDSSLTAPGSEPDNASVPPVSTAPDGPAEPVIANAEAAAAAVDAAPPLAVKKSRKGAWVAMAAVVVLLVAGVGGFFAYTRAQEQKAFDAALDELEVAFEKYDDAEPSDESPQAFSESAKPIIADFRTAVVKASKDIEPLGDSDKRTAALKALTSLKASLDSVYASMEDFDAYGKLEDEVDAVYADLDAGSDAQNEATESNNAEKWDEAVAHAQAALASYDAATAKATALEAKRPGVGFSDLLKEISMSRALVDKNLAMSGYGRSDKIDAYNKTIDEANDIQKQLAALPDPAFVDDPGLLEGDIFADMKGAEREVDKAMKTLEGLR